MLHWINPLHRFGSELARTIEHGPLAGGGHGYSHEFEQVLQAACGASLAKRPTAGTLDLLVVTCKTCHAAGTRNLSITAENMKLNQGGIVEALCIAWCHAEKPGMEAWLWASLASFHRLDVIERVIVAVREQRATCMGDLAAIHVARALGIERSALLADEHDAEAARA